MCIQTRDEGHVSLLRVKQEVETFDHVVLCVHAKQALQTLANNATWAERDILPYFRTTKNICVLHSDESVSFYLPKTILKDCLTFGASFFPTAVPPVLLGIASLQRPLRQFPCRKPAPISASQKNAFQSPSRLWLP